MITILFELVGYLVSLYGYIVLFAAIYSMLVAFGVIDTRNRLVWTIGDFLYRATEPVLRPIRNLLPNLGGIDISPWIVLILCWWLIPRLLMHAYAALAGNLGALVL